MSHGTMRAVLLSLLSLGLAVALVGCGNGSGGGSPTSSPADQAALSYIQKMVVVKADFPPGLADPTSTVTTNEDLSSPAADPKAELQKLLGYGRRLGYDVQMVVGPSAAADYKIRGVEDSVSLYKTASGAQTAFNDGIAQERARDRKADYSDETQVQVGEVTRADLSPGIVWFRATGFDSDGALVVDDQVAFRTGPIRAFLRVVSLHKGVQDRAIYENEVTGWLQKFADRINLVLKSAPPPA